MVKGEIQTIPQYIFDKFSFPSYGLAKIQTDAEIDNYSLIYVPVLSNSVNSKLYSYSYFMYTNESTLVLFNSFSNHLNIRVQIVRILSSDELKSHLFLIHFST